MLHIVVLSDCKPGDSEYGYLKNMILREYALLDVTLTSN